MILNLNCYYSMSAKKPNNRGHFKYNHNICSVSHFVTIIFALPSVTQVGSSLILVVIHADLIKMGS